MEDEIRPWYYQYLSAPKSIAPLITFRILFGLLMMIGALRFMAQGWIEKLYLEPQFFFKFYGFHWVEPLGETGMYMLYTCIAASAFLIAIGLFYRIATLLFFLSFTYAELIDATNYLNHYYLVCLFAFLLLFVPANSAFSLDTYFGWTKKRTQLPAWCINIFILQLSIVYTFAGIAKLNPDWLFRAMPLAIWLPEHQDLPIVGSLLKLKWVAFAFSWFAAFYDLSIAWFLRWKKSRGIAYIAVLLFHGLTGLFFNIGLFPLIMISSTLIFFSADWHERLLTKIGWRNEAIDYSGIRNWKIMKPVLFSLFLIQLLLPFRYLGYPGHLLWTEQGYRFSWRVMVLEKSGQATFFVTDGASSRKQEVVNGSYLTQFQEKQMCIQPDFILQYAHFLQNEFIQHHGFKNPTVTVDAHVALNGRVSQRFIDPAVNLAVVKDGFHHKNWIMPFRKYE